MAEKPDDKQYIQVTESMLSPETRERELRPLRMIPDNYEKIVLSMDRSLQLRPKIIIVEFYATQKVLLQV